MLITVEVFSIKNIQEQPERRVNMNDTAMKGMEAALRSYYRKLDERQVKKRALEAVEKNAEDIRRILLDVNQLIPSKGTVSSYRPVTGGGSGLVCDPTAQAYAEFTRSMERSQRELVVLLEKKIRLKMEIMHLESSIEGIGFALNLLDPVERMICEQYYGLKRKSNLQIGLALNMDEKTIRYRRKNINQKLSDYLKVKHLVKSG